MRNIAKCKICESVIESFHRYDYVSCKCGEIAVDGGTDYFRAVANDFNNFLRVDDEGNEIVVTFKDEAPQPKETVKLTRKDLIDMLDSMTKNIENMPQSAMTLPITHYDFAAALMILSSIFKSD